MATAEGIQLLDYQTDETTVVPLPSGVMPRWCQQFAATSLLVVGTSGRVGT